MLPGVEDREDAPEQPEAQTPGQHGRQGDRSAHHEQKGRPGDLAERQAELIGVVRGHQQQRRQADEDQQRLKAAAQAHVGCEEQQRQVQAGEQQRGGERIDRPHGRHRQNGAEEHNLFPFGFCIVFFSVLLIPEYISIGSNRK